MMPVAFPLAALTGANLVLGYLGQWLVMTTIGPGVETDAFFAGMAVPQFGLAVITGCLVYVLVPLLSTKDDGRFRRDAWTVLLAAGGGVGALSLLLILLAPWWTLLLFPGFSGRGRVLVVELARIQLAGMGFTVLAAGLGAACHARRRFLAAEAGSIAAGLLSLAYLWWALPRAGIGAAAWALLLKMALQSVFLVPLVGFLRWGDWEPETLSEAWRRMRPLLCGAVFYKTEPLLDRFLASFAPAGSLSIFSLARQVYDAGGTVLSRAIVSPMVPSLAVSVSAGDWRGYETILRKRLAVMGAVVSAVVVAVIFLGEDLIGLAFGGGKFDAASVRSLWLMMGLLGAAFAFGQVSDILAFAFYAFGDTTTPTRIISGLYAVSGVAKAAGFVLFGVPGLALASGLYMVLLGIALFLALRGSVARRKSSRQAGEAAGALLHENGREETSDEYRVDDGVSRLRELGENRSAE